MTGNEIILEDINFIIGCNYLSWNKFAGKTILIAGANGFLPAYMVEVLLQLRIQQMVSDMRVIALVRDIEKARERFKNYLRYPFLEFIVQDVSDEIHLNRPVHFIIHAASQASPKYYGRDPIGTLSANVLGTINLLKLAERNPVQAFLYFSSSEVYGNVLTNNPIHEKEFGSLDPVDVRSCYAEGKRVGETLCVSWLHQREVPVKIIRPFHTYGPGMALDDGRVFADFVSAIVLGKNIILNSNGSAMRSFCYLADATKAFFLVLLYGENGEAYNIGNPLSEISILELANMLVKLYPEKCLTVEQKKDYTNGYIKSSILYNLPDITKIQQLGWMPTTSLEEGFSKTIMSYTP